VVIIISLKRRCLLVMAVEIVGILPENALTDSKNQVVVQWTVVKLAMHVGKMVIFLVSAPAKAVEVISTREPATTVEEVVTFPLTAINAAAQMILVEAAAHVIDVVFLVTWQKIASHQRISATTVEKVVTSRGTAQSRQVAKDVTDAM